ncbi:MAG: cupin domain-containing protein [Planctomycetes bacterium]|nr:cupin domain-containing protein [Planctomycetota bacterium]
MSHSIDRGAPTGPSWRCAEHENAALHATGALEAAERARFAAHAEACGECNAEFEQHAATVATLDVLHVQDDVAHGRGAEAPERVRSALLAAIELERTPTPRAADAAFDRKWQRWSDTPGETIAPGLVNVASSADGFEEIGIAGIEVKRLSVDAEARKATMLIRMAAGTSYPRHRHAAREECFVLDGTLRVGASTLRAGDFQVAERDSIHEVQSTDTGCLLLIVSSQDDELV